MWTPPYNRMDDAEARALVGQVGAADLITVGELGYPVATRLPVIWDGDRLLFHLAVANPQWRGIADGSPALAVVTGPEAYVSPSWYPARQEHGRVVPTWNYTAVHVTGRVTVHRDPEWLLDAVTALTDLHEGRRESPWRVTDAPEGYVAQNLRAIVGLELVVEGVEGRAKRSQNRSVADREGVVAGLRESGPEGVGSREQALAAQMEDDLAAGPGVRG